MMWRNLRCRARRAVLPLAVVGLAAAVLAVLFYRLPDVSRALSIATPPVAPPAREPPFRAFVESLWPEAARKGIGRVTFDRALGEVEPDLALLEQLQVQPEYEKTTGEYLAALVSEERIAQGRAKLAEHAALLARIEARYGVAASALIAVWGIESDYGREMGGYQVPRTLATLAFRNARRAPFWKAELIAALTILERGDIALPAMTGSWAGAMGHTQFMPSTFLQFAVDFDNDGRRDIWRSAPDALASAANYLKAKGWQAGEPWGFEVLLPAGFNFELAGLSTVKPFGDWQQLGLRRPADIPWPHSERAWSVLLPSGAQGPAFLVSGNFNAILRYNNSASYALAIGHLSDRVAGAEASSTRWPDAGHRLTRPQKQELQQLLQLRGYNTGALDGMIGEQTRGAVRLYQKAEGLPPDGYPSLEVLQRLRGPPR